MHVSAHPLTFFLCACSPLLPSLRTSAMSCTFLFSLLLLLVPVVSLQLTFDVESCSAFRQLLSSHSLSASSNGVIALRLGVSALALFWVPVVPLVLGVAGLVVNSRMETVAWTRLRDMGVTKNNWEIVNAQCADLLEQQVLIGMTWHTGYRETDVLCGLAIMYAVFALVALAFCFVRIERGSKTECTVEYETYEC